MLVTIDQIKKLREKTRAGVMDCRRALEEAKGDMKKAETLLTKWDVQKAEMKTDRETKAGAVEAYVHAGAKVGAMIELQCETDFVARTDEFKHLAHELCLQVASMNPKDVSALLRQAYIRDLSITVDQLVKQTIGKLGENIKVVRLIRFELGKSIINTRC